MKYFATTVFLFISICLNGYVVAESKADPAVDDTPLTEALSLPDWFKLSFLDIKEDINEANRGKRGLIIYFGQSYCPYCKALLTNNWGRKDIVAYTRANFDVIAVNVRGNSPVIDIDGKEYTEKYFSAHYKANFTPTILFFDNTGKQALKLSGYRKPYQFRAALEFVADKHHLHESFRDYLARAEQAESFGQDTLNSNDIFSPPPYNLVNLKKNKPVAVFFEETHCHSCDVLHAGPLNRSEVLNEFNNINAIQLDMWAATQVITPQGKRTTAKKWADELALDYAPTIIFYDETGKEIIRVDSVVGFLRMKSVLQFINTRAYRKQPSYQLWRSEEFNKKQNQAQ